MILTNGREIVNGRGLSPRNPSRLHFRLPGAGPDSGDERQWWGQFRSGDHIEISALDENGERRVQVLDSRFQPLEGSCASSLDERTRIDLERTGFVYVRVRAGTPREPAQAIVVTLDPSPGKAR